MKSSSPYKKISSCKKMHRAMVRKQSEKDRIIQRIHDDLQLAVEDDDYVHTVETWLKKAVLPSLRQHVTKTGHVPCKECKRERQKGDGLGFHFCPNDEVVVEFRTEVDPIARPPARNSGMDPHAAGRTG